MHELSIALSIVETASEQAERFPGARVCAVHLKLGALAGVVKDALLFAYDLSCDGTPIEGSRLVIEDRPAIVYCFDCRAERTLGSIQHFVCPQCGAPTEEVVGGRELEVSALEIEE